MKVALAQLSNDTLAVRLKELVARDCRSTAELLAQFDRRRLYAPAGYSSLYDYCVQELRMSQDVALKRIRTARAAQRFAMILPAIVDGRLNVSGVSMLTRHLTEGNGAELLAAGVGKTNKEIAAILAERFAASSDAGEESCNPCCTWLSAFR